MILVPLLLFVIAAGGAVAYSSAAGCGKTTELNVVASPDIQPVVMQIAADVDKKSGGLLGGRLMGQCTRITVLAVDSAEAAAALASGEVHKIGNPDAWIPDSSVWLGAVKASEENTDRLGTSSSIASSPVVLAMVRPAAEEGGWPGRQISWGELFASYGSSPVKVGIAEPARTASTLLTMVGISAALESAPDADLQMVAAMRVLGARSAGTIEEVLGKLPQTPEELASTSLGRVGAFPYNEQGVWRYNQDDPAIPLAAIYPSGGTASLDYPFTMVSRDGATREVAENIREAAGSLLEELLGDAGRRALQARGFRTADGSAGSVVVDANGVLPDRPTEIPLPDAAAVGQLHQLWDIVSRNARILAVLDVSGSMSGIVEGTNNKTRMDLAKAAIQAALPLLREDTSVGFWTFSVRLDGAKDYKELVPIGALGGLVSGQPRREVLAGAVGQLSWKPNGATGLYDTALAAFRVMNKGYEADKINVVVLLTDGKNEDTGSISLSALTKALQKEFDPQRPVAIISIGFGPDADGEALKAISDATHGESYVTTDPTLIQTVLLEAIAGRAAA